MNNSNDLMSLNATNKLKHETNNMYCSQVELKLTELTLFDAHTLPIHGTAWRVCVWSSFNVCVPHHH